jgi:hypothetical protein
MGGNDRVKVIGAVGAVVLAVAVWWRWGPEGGTDDEARPVASQDAATPSAGVEAEPAERSAGLPHGAGGAPPVRDAGGPPRRAPDPVAPLQPQDPAERTVALFDDRAPQVLRDTFERVIAGRRIDPRDAVVVYQHGQDDPRDVRPPLVLGYDAMNRKWTEFGLDHYRNAHRADPEIRWDPRLMADLIRASGSEHHRDKALAAMSEIYGADTRLDLERRAEATREVGGEAAAELVRRLSQTLGH